MQNVSWHRLVEISRDVTEEDVIWMAAYAAPKDLHVPLSISGDLTDVTVSHAMGTHTPETITVLFLFGPRYTMSVSGFGLSDI